MNYHQKKPFHSTISTVWTNGKKVPILFNYIFRRPSKLLPSPTIQQQSAARGQIPYTYHTSLSARKWYA